MKKIWPGILNLLLIAGIVLLVWMFLKKRLDWQNEYAHLAYSKDSLKELYSQSRQREAKLLTSRDSLSLLLGNLLQSNDYLAQSLSDLQDQNNNLISDLLDMPSDSLYDYLQVEYMDTAAKPYGFSGAQVGSLAVTHTEKIFLGKENVLLKRRVDTLEGIVSIQTGIISIDSSVINELEIRNSNLVAQLQLSDDQIEVLEKRVRRLPFWQGAAAVGTIAAIICIL